MCPNENPHVSQNALDRVGVESHAKLRGDVAARVTGFGTAAVPAQPSQDATALPDLRMVQTLFQAANISPPGRPHFEEHAGIVPSRGLSAEARQRIMQRLQAVEKKSS